MKHRRPDQKDGNNRLIRSEVEPQGVYIEEIDRPVDWLVHYNGFVALVEVKTETTEYKRGQLETAAFNPIPMAFVKSSAELMHFVKTGKGITEDQRQRIAIALSADKDRERWTPKQVKEILER